ncbi:MAG: hypothetical protein GY820_18815 [Gammaproteobacteria bacterium]|nr:hypothetical protein [Gammaproteobacteria bacterium]
MTAKLKFSWRFVQILKFNNTLPQQQNLAHLGQKSRKFGPFISVAGMDRLEPIFLRDAFRRNLGWKRRLRTSRRRFWCENWEIRKKNVNFEPDAIFVTA